MSQENKSNVSTESHWLSSTEAQKMLRVTSCHLMHIRLSGEIDFIKKGNAFLYKKQSLEAYLKIKTK